MPSIRALEEPKPQTPSLATRLKSLAMGILEKIKDIELEMSRTQKNKVRSSA